MKNRRTKGGGLGEWTYPGRGTWRMDVPREGDLENGRTQGGGLGEDNSMKYVRMDVRGGLGEDNSMKYMPVLH